MDDPAELDELFDARAYHDFIMQEESD
jgi:hypothetical protein